MRDNFTMIPSVPVTDIKLDVQNFRYYGELSNQDDCIKAMLDDPKSGIYELAEDIAQNGLTPDPIVLFKDEDGDWIVREGNRRITALKILDNPQLVNNATQRKKLIALTKKHREKIPNTVDCIACDDEECVLDYLDRLHTGFRNGTGRRPWTPENKTLYNMHRGRPGENALALKIKDMVIKNGVELKEPYKITNLQRILQNKGVQSILKFSWDGDNITTSVEESIFRKIMGSIAQQAGNIKAREIYLKEDQQKFVGNIISEHGVNIEENTTEPYLINSDKRKPKADKKGTIPIKASWDRKGLIPTRKTRLSIPDLPENQKARNIVNELARKIDVREAPNAAAVLFRVLLELSVERYMRDNQQDKKDSLGSNIRSVANHMERNGKILKDQKDEIVRMCSEMKLFSPKTLQRFVHSFDFNPDRQTLCTMWDNMDLFISKCW